MVDVCSLAQRVSESDSLVQSSDERERSGNKGGALQFLYFVAKKSFKYILVFH